MCTFPGHTALMKGDFQLYRLRHWRHETKDLADLQQLRARTTRGEPVSRREPRHRRAQVFGGQVLGQALTAAARAPSTGRVVHSLHAYFLRRGDFNAPIVYEVDRSRDGHSFTNRRVIAIQHGEQIFNMTASFQVVEAGLEHQIEMPKVPAPESCRT